MTDPSKHLKQKFFTMAAKVEESVELSIQGLLKSDLEKLGKVEELEKEINRLHLEVDDECFKYIALKQPVARELRFILTCLKANTDLERIGDQALNISQTSTLLVKNGAPILQELKDMTMEVLSMLHEALDSFIKLDFPSANSVFRRENTVNEMKKMIFTKIISEATNIKDIELYLEIILISRNLERIGDHAQNISEYLIFLEEGKDVRHSKFLDKELTYVRNKA